MLSHIWGIFSSTSSSSFFVPTLKSQSRGPNSSLEAQIPVLRPKSKPQVLNPSFQAQILAWKLRSGSQGWELGLLAGIWTLRLRFWPQGWNLGLQARIRAWKLGFRTRGLDLGLETGIWASKLEFGPRDCDLRGGTKEEEEEVEEKIPHMCESIGHPPLRGRCPKKGAN